MSIIQSYQEKELLARIAEGDHRAFETLFIQYHPAIYTIVFRLCNSAELAKDICQDSFLKVWLNRDKLRQFDNFSGWLHTVAANLTYDVLRKKKADALREDRYSEQKNRADYFTATETLLLEKEYAMLVQNAIASLPPKQREVFILVKEQGLSREEVANRLGISPETVKSNLQAATQKFRAYCIAHLGLAGIFILNAFHQ